MFHNIIVYHSTLTVVFVGFVRKISRHLRTLIRISVTPLNPLIRPHYYYYSSVYHLRKKRHKILLTGSPCFTPTYELMRFEVANLYRINDLTAEYNDLKAWMNLVLMRSAKRFCLEYILSILSNIFPS